jgi:hypothetical protein
MFGLLLQKLFNLVLLNFAGFGLVIEPAIDGDKRDAQLFCDNLLGDLVF